jgi:hypothetical protein
MKRAKQIKDDGDLEVTLTLAQLGLFAKYIQEDERKMSVEAMKAALEVLEGIGLKTEEMQNAIALLRLSLVQEENT